MNIKLTDKDKIRISQSDDIFGIMQRILLRDNKIDREKEHFWIVGLDPGNYISYIELISLGTVKSTLVEPMHVFRVAIQKGAVRVIAVHNHPSGRLHPSAEDKDTTDRLIQVGRIINIELIEHIIISTKSYFSFGNDGLLEELEKSTKYVPTYQLIERIKNEEEAIRVEMQKELKEKNALLKENEKQRKNAVHHLIERNISIDQIAIILEMSENEILKITKKKSTK